MEDLSAVTEVLDPTPPHFHAASMLPSEHQHKRDTEKPYGSVNAK